MRADWQGTPSRHTRRDVSIRWYAGASFAEVRRGRRSALPWSATRYYRVGDLAINQFGEVVRCAIAHSGVDPRDYFFRYLTGTDDVDGVLFEVGDKIKVPSEMWYPSSPGEFTFAECILQHRKYLPLPFPDYFLDHWEIIDGPPSPPVWVAAVEADYAIESPSDLTPHVQSASHSSSELRVTVTGHTDAVIPSGAVIEVRDNVTGQILWLGYVENVESRTSSRGVRTASLRARSRDAAPLWRDLRWASEVYPAGTDLGVIATDVAVALGLESDEILGLDSLARTTPHTTTQMADVPAWDMLSAVLLPLQAEPFVDALGRLKMVSRDCRRPHSRDVLDADVVSIGASVSGSPTSAVVVSWLDRSLTKSIQQEQVLGTMQITAGFFDLHHTRSIWWSKDRTQRAEETRLKVLRSVNDGLLPVGDESYEQVDEFHGRIRVETSAWVPTLATLSMSAYLGASAIPDEVVMTSTSTGITVSVGRLVEGAAAIVIWLIMMSIGTGQYEVWGRPYDYVHARNKTEAYATGVPQWARRETVIECDLVTDEQHAQELAISELVYANFAATRLTVDVADDPRIEPGDELRVSDDVRVYVIDYDRDLTRGAENVLRVTGFRV